MKKILFVINTMGRAGAETALLELLRRLKDQPYEISLYVLMGQGELFEELPSYIRVLNTGFSTQSVLSGEGRRRMTGTVLSALWRNKRRAGKMLYIVRNLAGMLRDRRVQIDKLLWRVISDGAECFDETFDLAVAWLEGGSAYYVADHVKANRKAVFIHIDYENAGYTRAMDQDCFREYERIFAVSYEVKRHFQAFYPEYASKVRIFHNMLDQEGIRRRAMEAGGFMDGYDGMRLLSVGRLTYQKGYDIAVEAMGILKESGYRVRWYVLGEGNGRKALEKKIAKLGLEEDFLLMGAVGNPYPYYVQTDLYVHTARYEGRSIAIQEAKLLGCAVVACKCSGHGQITDGMDGILCGSSAQSVADSIKVLLEKADIREALGRAAAAEEPSQEQELKGFLKLLS